MAAPQYLFMGCFQMGKYPLRRHNPGYFSVNTLMPDFLTLLSFFYLFRISLLYMKQPANTDIYGLFLPPRVGLEPTTLRLTAECSTCVADATEKQHSYKNSKRYGISRIIIW